MFLQVHQDHPAGPQRAPLAHLRGGQVEHPGLGGEDHEAVLGDGVAGRAQAVAVEHGAHGAAVGEDHGRGAVPGLHEAGVVFEEAAQVGAHGVLGAPGLRDEHDHGVVKARGPPW